MRTNRNTRISELGLIDYLTKNIICTSPLVFKGIGDDAAVIKIDKDRYLLSTCDMLIEGKHFTKRDSLIDVGYKAMSCSLSDIAAMGGEPKFALVSLGLPKRFKFRDIHALYRGFSKALDRFCVEIVGGDSNLCDKLIIDISMIGFVNSKKLVLRSNAKTGDYIFVTGSLGGSFYRKHLRFLPRIKEAKFLLDRFKLNSMIDISDGLVIDLYRILQASGVGAVIFENLIPVDKDAKNLEEALYMGEDFELIFTLSNQEANRLLSRINQNKIGFSLSFIGKIIDEKSKIYLLDKDSKRFKALKMKGFLHF